jgi:signal transduction histidine kinase
MALQEVGQAITSVFSLDTVLELILTVTLRDLEAEIGSVMLWDPEARELRVSVSAGLEEEYTSAGGMSPFAQHVFETSEPLLVRDVTASPLFSGTERSRYSTRSLISAPIVARGCVLGVINVNNKTSGVPMDESDLQLLELIAQQAALAIENAGLARDLRIARQQVVRAEKMRLVGQLAAGLMHELNNPLQVILGFAASLASEPSLDSDGRQDAEIIQSEARRCSSILHALRSLSPASARAEPTDINALAERVLVLLRHHTPPGVTIERRLDPQLPLVTADPGQMEQVLFNLVLNAYQAMPDAGRLVLASSVQGGWARLAVEDDGPGIEPDCLGQVFDPFFSTKGDAAGRGLGLYVCQLIVEGHGGRIEVASPPGSGARFEVLLPLTGEKD